MDLVRYIYVFIIITLVHVGLLTARGGVAVALDLTDLSSELNYLSTRDMVISKNVANADTPHYLPKDLHKPPEIGDHMKLFVTEPGHLQIDDIPDYNIYDSEVLEMKPNGNGITLEHELHKKSDTALQFSETSQLYNKAKGMLRTAFVGSK